MIFRFEAPLYFANMEYFRQMLIKRTGLDPIELQRRKHREQQTSATARHYEVNYEIASVEQSISMYVIIRLVIGFILYVFVFTGRIGSELAYMIIE